MALKKSELYSSLWSGCDELRGGMDAMRHFATESGKSKGQFYTPAEVSRVMAQILGIRHAKTSTTTTVYDPTCGSGSLLLKVGDAATAKVTLYGQEKDASTSGLARMNMILHDYATALVVRENTLSTPLFKDGDALKTFDYVVANPPFSDKRWSTGLDPDNDPFERFRHFGVPPAKQGDYAYLLHILRSLKSTGKGACILPHGVLFRGNAEAAITQTMEELDDKWLATIAAAVQGELDRVSQTLTGRIRQLAERYVSPLPQLTGEVATLAARVDGHLKKMGFKA